MKPTFCHLFLAFILKFLNFLQTFLGISIILYSVYMLNQWNSHSIDPPPPSAPSPNYADAPFPNLAPVGGVPDHDHDRVTPLNLVVGVIYGLNDGLNLQFQELPAPWFIYAFMGVGIMVCCITFIGQIAADAINGCCLCFYSLLTALFILLEAALVSYIAVDQQWDKHLPFDPTGELDSMRGFVEENLDICKRVGIAVAIIQALSLLLAMILRPIALSSRRGYHDIEGDYDDTRGRVWDPLLNSHLSPASGSLKADAKGVHSNIWSSRIREKYGLYGGDVKSNLLNQNAPVNEKSNQ